MPRENFTAPVNTERTNKDGTIRPDFRRKGMKMDLNTVKHKAKAQHSLENGIINVTRIKIPQPRM